MKQYEQLQKKILQARHNKKNITDALVYEMPASPLLQELVVSLPAGVVMNKMELDYQPVRRKVVNPDNNQVVYKQVIERTLKLTLAGPKQIESDQAVDKYIQTLRSCAFLARVAQEVRIISRQEMEIDNQTMALYEIECPLIEQK